MPEARLSSVSVVAVLLLTALAGCDGDGDDGDERGERPGAVDGTFVGKVKGTRAFVAVVAAPSAQGKERRNVSVFVCDARRVCEWLPGSATGDSFTATSDDRDASAKGKLSGDAASGTIKLPGGKSVRYSAKRATAATGLYEVTVSANGKLRGASEAGVALTGTSRLPSAGTGRVKLADGKRLPFVVTRNATGERPPFRAGRLRLIVLPGGELRGAGTLKRARGQKRGRRGGKKRRAPIAGAVFVRSTSR